MCVTSNSFINTVCSVLLSPFYRWRNGDSLHLFSNSHMVLIYPTGKILSSQLSVLYLRHMFWAEHTQVYRNVLETPKIKPHPQLGSQSLAVCLLKLKEISTVGTLENDSLV